MLLTETLDSLLKKWEEWSTSADRSEDGWESDFPEWGVLMESAAALTSRRVLSEDDLRVLERCWEISEETEELAEQAREDPQTHWTCLLHLAKANSSRVRWQVYSVLGDAGESAQPVLREALRDPDAYCRRRAFIALGQTKPRDAWELAEEYLRDPDPYLRQAVLAFAQGIADPALLHHVKSVLKDDVEAHVREAALYVS